MSFVRRLLDPELGGRVRAVLRTLGAFATLGALSQNADEIVAVLTSLQALLAVLVMVPTPAPNMEDYE